jgi:trimeric autotransporter adhesin
VENKRGRISGIMKTTTLQLRNSVNRLHVRLAFLLISLVCFALSPQARGTCQEGCDTSTNNTFLGEDALFSNNGGLYNTAVGYQALYSNTAGIQNTATGSLALFFNTTGYENTANGISTLYFNTTGYGNTATGAAALTLNTIGNDNTATGGGALNANQTGSNNTATGHLALEISYSGNFNTATGDTALQNNEFGNSNTATGSSALQSNTAGNSNTADGARALQQNKAGGNNTAVGFDALRHNEHGRNNIALGFEAGLDLNGNDNVDIGNRGITGDSNAIRIGTEGTHMHTFVAGISGATVADGVGVVVGADGHLGTVVSSARFKDAIKPMDKASEAILSLKPVTFRYKHELDPDGIPQFGLVAEDVEKVDTDLVARDEQGKPYTVRYEAVNAMLLNEFLKEHRTVQELKTTVAQQQKQIEALTEGLQKVSARLELSKSGPQTVLNNQ